ncbi:MAG: pyrroline-5-carboxylate reductase dimerization domain-containing protein, partial [Pseudomonadota bacterium]
ARLGTARINRAMPNTPGAIGQGVTLVSPGPGATTTHTALATDLLAPLGLVEGPMDENQLSVATAVSGCGPAYLFLLAEILGDAGAEAGLDPAVSARIAEATVTGAAALLASGDTSPADLRRAVTSPNGVTQAALEVLMAENGWPSPMHRAIAAAIARDAALSAALDAEKGDGQD